MPDVLSPADTTVGSGAFNKRITIQKPIDTPNSPNDGGATRIWSTVFTTWAHIEPWKGSEAYIAQQVYPKRLSRFLIRYRASVSIDASMQILYGKRKYNIRDVSVPAEALTTIEIVAEELQAVGSLH
jgi:SPP1 family predicted phage head-tail adaptor